MRDPKRPVIRYNGSSRRSKVDLRPKSIYYEGSLIYEHIPIYDKLPLKDKEESMTAYGHRIGDSIECLSIPIVLKKEQVTDRYGTVHLRVGFKIGGGVDQDPSRAPYKYPDAGIYITNVESDSPAEHAGLRQHDKILQVNGSDFTMMTHERAVKYIKRYDTLHLLVARAGIPPLTQISDPL